MINLSTQQALGRLEGVVGWHIHLQSEGTTFVHRVLGSSNIHIEKTDIIVRRDHLDARNYSSETDIIS